MTHSKVVYNQNHYVRLSTLLVESFMNHELEKEFERKWSGPILVAIVSFIGAYVKLGEKHLLAIS